MQADPIRAPARAQDLTLRHRVRGYRAGDLERRYAGLGVQEDFFVNYGFVAEEVQALMHPRGGPTPWPRSRARGVEALLDFVRARGQVHPREVDDHFAHGKVTNYWGGSSNATTHLLENMHYRGLLRVVRRDRGIRIYAAHDHPLGPLDRASRLRQLDALVDVAVWTYAPLPGGTLSWLINRLRYTVPQSRRDLKSALSRAKTRLSHARLEGADWYWPASGRTCPTRRLMAACACSRPLIRLSGIGGASGCSGDGSIASKRTRRRTSGGSATTRCRCCGATR